MSKKKKTRLLFEEVAEICRKRNERLEAQIAARQKRREKGK